MEKGQYKPEYMRYNLIWLKAAVCLKELARGAWNILDVLGPGQPCRSVMLCFGHFPSSSYTAAGLRRLGNNTGPEGELGGMGGAGD